MSVFGFAHTNLSLVFRHCRSTLGSSGVQVVTPGDVLVRRRCYVVLGVDTLDVARVKLLNRSSAVAVIVDALPSLQRIENIILLDTQPDAIKWGPDKARFARLEQALRAKPKPLILNIKKDNTLEMMVAAIRERSVLDSVLSAAKSMEISDRALLHVDVAQMLMGKISMASFQKRCESRAHGRLYDRMLDRLSDDTAKRLSTALKQAKDGADVIPIATKNRVEASEIRFLLAKLKGKYNG